jgi:hypothetical protein
MGDGDIRLDYRLAADSLGLGSLQGCGAQSERLLDLADVTEAEADVSHQRVFGVEATLPRGPVTGAYRLVEPLSGQRRAARRVGLAEQGQAAGLQQVQLGDQRRGGRRAG